MKHIISVTRAKRGLGSPEAARVIKKAVRAALAAESVDEPCEVSVRLTDDEGIRGKNKTFRGIDRPTDVLSFPMNDLEPGRFDAAGAERDLDTGHVLLGDVLISLERIRAQGAEFGHGEERELAYITVHSVLHLLGYDHVDEGPMKRQMRAREKDIMASLEAGVGEK